MKTDVSGESVVMNDSFYSICELVYRTKYF